MRFSKPFKTLLVCFLTLGMSAVSQMNAQQQVEVSDAELDKIAAAFQGIQKINMEAQQKVMKTVEESGIEANRFNEMYQASVSPEQTVEASDEEKEEFGKVMNQIQEMQTGFQKQMEEVVGKEGISMERYEKIAMALQTDTALQQRLQALLVKQQQP